MPGRFKTFLGELRRRKVTHVALLYIVVGIAVIEAADLLLEPLQLGSLYPAVVVLTIICFPIALVLAWAYDVSPSGVQRASGSESEERSLTARDLAEAGGDSAEISSVLPLPKGPVIAVLPFANVSGDRKGEFFTDGITEDIITALSRFTNLFVIDRNASMGRDLRPGSNGR